MEVDVNCSVPPQGCMAGGGEGSSSSMAVVPSTDAEKTTSWRNELAPELRFPPGYHFLPSDEELVDVYLRAKNEGRAPPLDVIKDVEILYFHPDVLIEKHMQYGEKRWYFFTKREKSRSKQTELRRKLHTEGDKYCWKATGNVVPILRSRGRPAVKIGTKRILIYHSAVAGEEEKWSMNEYVMTEYPQMDQWILCTIQIKLRWDSKRKSAEKNKKGKKITNKKTKKTTKRRKKSDSSQTQEQTTDAFDCPLTSLMLDHDIHRQALHEEDRPLAAHNNNTSMMVDHPTGEEDRPLEAHNNNTSMIIEHPVIAGEEDRTLAADNNNTSMIVEHPIITGDHHQTLEQAYSQLEPIITYEAYNNLEAISVTRNQPEKADVVTSSMGQRHQETNSDCVLTNGYSSSTEHLSNSGEQQGLVSAGDVTSDYNAAFTDFNTGIVVPPPEMMSDPEGASMCPHSFEWWEINKCRLC